METQHKTYGIEEATMLMTTSVSVWTARKLDRGASDEIMDSKSAGSRSAARVNKNLMAGRTELEEIQKIVGAARTYMYANTAPWSDAGQRWIPITRLLKVDKRMQLFKQQFDEEVAVFCNVYGTLITAQAMA